MPARWNPAVDGIRRALAQLATNHAVRRLMVVSSRELTRAAEQGLTVARIRETGIADTYGGSYFGEGRDASGDRAGLSGYARYDRIASNADIAGWLLWRNFRVATSLDVGCATGYLVEVLRERGIDAEGCDVSQFAIDHAAPGCCRPHPGGQPVRRSALAGSGLRAGDRARDPRAPAPRTGSPSPWPSSAGCAAGISTPPSPRSDPTGPDPTDIFEGKVRPERVDHYRRWGPEYARPGARRGPGGRRRGPAGRGPPDHRLVRVVDRAVRPGRVHPLPRHRAPAVRRHRAGRPGPVLEHLRLQSGRCARGDDRAPVGPSAPSSELGLDHPLLDR